MSSRTILAVALGVSAAAVAVAWYVTSDSTAPEAVPESVPSRSVGSVGYRDVEHWVSHLERGKPVRFVRTSAEVPQAVNAVPAESEFDLRPLGLLSEQELELPRAHLRGLAIDARRRVTELLDSFDPSDPKSTEDWGRHVLEAESCDAAARQLEQGRYFVLENDPRQSAPDITFYTLPCLKDGEQVMIHFALRHDEHPGVENAAAFATHQARAALTQTCDRFNALGYDERRSLITQRDAIFTSATTSSTEMGFLSREFPVGVSIDSRTLLMRVSGR